MGESDAGDFQIHRANAQALTPKREEKLRRLCVPREDYPVGEGLDLALELGVGSNLAVRIRAAIYFSEPTTHFFLDCDDGQRLINDAQIEPLGERFAGLRVALQLRKVVCVKNQQSLYRRFAAADTRDQAEQPRRTLDRP